MRKRLGCLTPTGLLAALLTLFIIAGIWLVQGGIMFSPGALNDVRGPRLGGLESHAQAAGDCAACHAPPWDAAGMQARCADCHSAVAAEIQTLAGLHGHLALEASSMDCRACHTEHRGPRGGLTLANVDYPHDATGYHLTGHARHPSGEAFTCRDCHVQDFSASLVPQCMDCHLDLDAAYLQAHLAVFGDGCLACHDGIDTYGTDFDHAATAFALDGAHAQVGCAGCHSGMTSPAALQATPTGCFGCHAADDAHAGTLGTNCAACHSADGWLPALFDHDQSAFPLTGAHLQVACSACHANAEFAGTPVACAACHAEPQSHAGMFGTDCAACHTTQAWLPAGYDGPHAFPMNHGDANSCRDCHVDALTQWTCYTCHDPRETEEEHRDEGIADFADCLRCHADGEEPEEN